MRVSETGEVFDFCFTELLKKVNAKYVDWCRKETDRIARPDQYKLRSAMDAQRRLQLHFAGMNPYGGKVNHSAEDDARELVDWASAELERMRAEQDLSMVKLDETYLHARGYAAKWKGEWYEIEIGGNRLAVARSGDRWIVAVNDAVCQFVTIETCVQLAAMEDVLRNPAS